LNKVGRSLKIGALTLELMRQLLNQSFTKTFWFLKFK